MAGGRVASVMSAVAAMAALAVSPVVAGAFVSGGASAATNWPVMLAANAGALADSTGVPAAPGTVLSACSGTLLAPTVTVTWSAVIRASSYSVFESTTSSTGGFSKVASGVSLLTWTTPTLGNGSYWFEVAAYSGSNWVGPNSASTVARTVLLGVSCT